MRHSSFLTGHIDGVPAEPRAQLTSNRSSGAGEDRLWGGRCGLCREDFARHLAEEASHGGARGLV